MFVQRERKKDEINYVLNSCVFGQSSEHVIQHLVRATRGRHVVIVGFVCCQGEVENKLLLIHIYLTF